MNNPEEKKKSEFFLEVLISKKHKKRGRLNVDIFKVIVEEIYPNVD